MSGIRESVKDFKSLSLITKLWLIASVTAAVFLSLYWTFWSTKFVSTENAYVETDLSPVNSRMMGFVREILVHENEVVKKGQLLLKFDDTDSALELSYKKAKFAKVSADFARAEKLHREHAISESDWELAQATMTGTKAEYDGALLKMKFTEIVAPVDGVVAKRSAQVGQFVQPGQSLFVVVPLDDVWIKANFKESIIRLIHPGQKVEVEVDAYPDEKWDGEVDFVYPSSVASLSLLPPENATGNFTKVVQRFPVRVKVNQQKDKPLLPGMSVFASIRVK